MRRVSTTSLIRRMMLVSISLGVAACSNPFSGSDCLSLGVPGISATVVDAITNKAPSSTPKLRIEDGAFVEELNTPLPRVDPPTFIGALERAGVYRVTVTSTGYQPFVAEGITVSRGGKCQDLRGAKLDVKLASIRQ